MTTRQQQLAQEVWDLRLAGYSVPEIAGKLGVSRVTVWRRQQHYALQVPEEDAQALRVLGEARIEWVIRRVRGLLEQAELSYKAQVGLLRLLLSAEQQRAKLLGIEVPTEYVIRAESASAIQATVVSDSIAAVAGGFGSKPPVVQRPSRRRHDGWVPLDRPQWTAGGDERAVEEDLGPVAG